MRAKVKLTGLVILFWVTFSLALSPMASAQCYLGSGCKPVDNLNYQPNGTGQVYHGDGASNNGTGGWTTAYSDVNQCLSCHYGTDTYPYLMTSHRNTMRKIAPGTLWAGPDGINYPVNDPYYGSGSTYDWTNGLITLGWCDPFWTQAKNGLQSMDPECIYPYYTLPNANASASYTPVAPTIAAGGVRNLYYLFGGWQNYGSGTTQLGTVFDSGSTGELYPYGDFDCARCHATGYNFDASGPEPTKNTNNQVARISDLQFPRMPSDGYMALGTNGTSSWYLSGIQCERCHVAAYAWGSHPWTYNVTPTIAHNEGATALCMECHRQENVTKANNLATPPTPGSINPSNTLQTVDRGYCSDMSGSSYATCVANSSNHWVYKPYLKYAEGQSFLNSPHARFSGTLIQNAQHSADLSIVISGNYDSYFSQAPTDPSKNSGCTGCHDPHQSTVASVTGAKPIVNTCSSCHKLSQNILATVNHPAGPGTPFPTGTSADLPGACVTCHMQAALGRANMHVFRINPDPNYWTYPTPSQFYTQHISAPGTEPDGDALDGVTYNPAVWLDVDLACGQCHIGNDGVTNEYGLVPPPGLPGSHAYTRAQLAYWASTMHPGDPGVPTPMFSPTPTTYAAPQSVTISDSMTGATIYYTMDGSLPNTNSLVYSTPIQITSTTTFRAMATYPGYPHSNVALAVYTINLPTAPAPSFWPVPSTYSTAQSITISNTASLPMYYTTDGTTPTTNSTPYAVPISVSKNTTIKAITAQYGYITSPVSTGNYYIQAPAPTFSPSPGTYSTPQTVTISESISGATIYYTANGSTPTTSSPSCSSPCSIGVSTTTTIKAMAVGGSYAQSNTAVATYTITTAAPTLAPSPGTYYTPQTVTITDTSSGATIYYTTNGATPTTSSPSCSSPCSIGVSVTTTVKAMAIAPGLAQSSISVGTYTIAAATPTFSPGSGTYSTPLPITISDTTSGVTIYYTTNGTSPTTSSPSCSSPCPLTLTTTTTVKAMATMSGISQSSIAVATYTLH